jgi:uncharacterized protein YqeY
MTLQEQLKADMKEAMKNKDIVKRDTIRFLNSAIKQVEVDERKELNDADILKLIQKAIKQREDAIEQYQNAGREDLVQNESAQADVLKAYLPKQLTQEELEEEIKAIIAQTGAAGMKDIGKVMGTATKKLAGVTDGKKINACAKTLLS